MQSPSVWLYNSLTQKPEPVKPLEPGKLKMYVCGVTVYDDAHLGHLRAAYVFELFRRVFQAQVFQAQKWSVTYVRNITDVDDKIIEKARAESAAAGSLTAACKQVADRYLARYQAELTRFGIPTPDQEPKATEHMDAMIHLIKGLVAKGHAYVAGGDVYFRVRSWAAYGRLSHQSVEELRAGTRVSPGEQKEDPLDFALWKCSKPEEPSWESPWGPGRPGWHIECSAMSMRYLGESFDVHGGGRDLIFPHHENEIAQSEAATGCPFVRHWVHSGLVTVGGQKMAKSVGNIVRLDDVLARHPNPDILKLLMLMTHYSSPLDFTWGKLDEAAAAYQRFTTVFDTVDQLTITRERSQPAAIFGETEAICEGFMSALRNNMNTPGAVAMLFELVRLAHQALEGGAIEQAMAAVAELKSCGTQVGLFETIQAPRLIMDEKIQILLNRRFAARQAKDYHTADRLRREIEQQGYIVEDTPGGTICRPA